jgi:hypothetical protein
MVATVDRVIAAWMISLPASYSTKRNSGASR